MKKIIYILILGFTVSLFFTSCLKEDNVVAPVIDGFEMFVYDSNGDKSPITEPTAGQSINFLIYTEADIISIWPGGIRSIMKKKNSTADSIDMFNHPVLIKSDVWSDWGLVGARGLTTSATKEGWVTSYKYPTAGQFDLTIVATNHGYDGPDLQRTIHNGGKVTVK